MSQNVTFGIGVFLWSVVGVLASLVISGFFDFSFRYMIFTITVIVGAEWIFAVWTLARWEFDFWTRKKLPAPVQPALLEAPSLGEVVFEQELLDEDEEDNGGVLSPDAARDWLDDFLVRQQR